MRGAANDVWWDDLRQEAELPPPDPPSRSKAPLVVGLLAATAVAGGLGWWLSSPGKTYFDNPTLQAAPAETRAARPNADVEQVRRAYEEFSHVYANSGQDGLARFADSCQASLRGDPRILDFCLAFDLFADTVRDPAAEPPGQAEARRLALVQAALPGADPSFRVADVRRLMREAAGISIAAPSSDAAPPPASTQAAAQVPAAVARASGASPPAADSTPSPPARLAKAAPPRKGTAASPCRSRSTPADRLTCANPTLRIQERRMKDAYDRALKAGADPLVVDRAQAEWRALRNAADSRAELADLYARRTRELNSAAEAAAAAPPT